MPFRTGHVQNPEEDKNPLVLQGPAQQVSSRQLRPRAVRLSHLAPDVRDAIAAGGAQVGSNSNGRFWIIGGLLVCTHRLTNLSSGAETWTFPIEFAGVPRVNATPIHNAARSATVQLVTATEAEVRCWTDSGGTSNVNVDVTAIGVPA